MKLWQHFTNVIIGKTLLFKNGAVVKVVSTAGVESTIDLAELAAIDSIGAADLAKIDGITNGTAAAGKALVLGASKEIATITSATITTLTSTTVNATNVDAGASGTAGTVEVFPSTAAKGKLSITAADSAGDTTTTIVNASQAAARTYTIPDAGAAASFVMTEGTQTVNGAKTFGSAIVTAGMTSTAPTGVGIGYATGAGGAVTQITNRSTGVTLNKLCGTITGDATSLAGLAEAEFVVTNSTVALRDTIILSLVSGPTANTSQVSVSVVAAGSFTIKIRNMHATTADTGAPIINFAVIKAVNA